MRRSRGGAIPPCTGRSKRCCLCSSRNSRTGAFGNGPRGRRPRYADRRCFIHSAAKEPMARSLNSIDTNGTPAALTRRARLRGRSPRRCTADTTVSLRLRDCRPAARSAYRVDLDPLALGATVRRSSRSGWSGSSREIEAVPRDTEPSGRLPLFHMAGADDSLLHVIARDTTELVEFVLAHLTGHRRWRSRDQCDLGAPMATGWEQQAVVRAAHWPTPSCPPAGGASCWPPALAEALTDAVEPRLPRRRRPRLHGRRGWACCRSWSRPTATGGGVGWEELRRGRASVPRLGQ